MGLIIEHPTFDLLLIATALIAVIIAYFKHAHSYWARRGVPYLEPSIPMGNSHSIFNASVVLGLRSREYYRAVKDKGWKFGGVYAVTRPMLVITDLDYVKDILIKDFHHFVNRGFFYNEKADPISAHLFAMDGSDWKNMRVKLTQTFTSGKMKMMFDSALQCSTYMTDAMKERLKEPVNIGEMFKRFSTDVIGSCAFGINCNSFKSTEAEFRKMGRRIFEKTPSVYFRSFLFLNLPSLAKMLNVRVTKKDVGDFFIKVTKDTVEYRKKNNIIRKDFLQLLIELNDDLEKKGESGLTVYQMAAQVFLFFIAGFDTSSTTMTFALYELARNPDIQERVREEVNEVMANNKGKLTYDSLSELKYLQQVIDETLRMYPPVSTLNRDCVQDYKLRDTDIVLEKGTSVIISTFGIHRDPELYPDPDLFDPERFSEGNKHSRHPCAHLPFGDGPRNCIGLRFGLMQTRIGIAMVIKNFRVTISPKMVPLKLDPERFLLDSVDPILLYLEKI